MTSVVLIALSAALAGSPLPPPDHQAATSITINPETDGIQPLNEERHRAAIECGSSGQYPLCAGGGPNMCTGIEGFDLTLSTPFSRVAALVHEATRKFEEPPRTGVATANRRGVIVEVSAIHKLGKMLSVETLVLKRDGKVIKAVAQDLRVNSYSNAFGATDTAAEGAFSFPLGPWRPEGELELVLVPMGGGYARTCRLDRFDLSKFK